MIIPVVPYIEHVLTKNDYQKFTIVEQNAVRKIMSLLRIAKVSSIRSQNFSIQNSGITRYFTLMENIEEIFSNWIIILVYLLW